MFLKIIGNLLSLIVISITIVLFILYFDSISKDYLIPIVASIASLIALYGIEKQYKINEQNNAIKVQNNKKVIHSYLKHIVDIFNYEIKTLNEMKQYCNKVFKNKNMFINGKTIVYNKLNEYTNKLLDRELHTGLNGELFILSIELRDLYFELLDTKIMLEKENLSEEKGQENFFKFINNDIERLNIAIRKINEI